MGKIKLIKQLIILFFFGIFIFSCSYDGQQNSQLQQESDNFIKKNLAVKIANNISFKTNTSSSSKKNASTKKLIKEILPVKDENAEIVFYIINYENGGFIILSADNRISPILAYSDANEFRTSSNNYPSGLVEWLSLLKDTIKSVREKNLKQSKELKQEWDSFYSQKILYQTNLNSSKSKHDSSNNKEAPIDDPNDCDDEFEQVGPLLLTTWNQTCGYNDYMPVLDCSAGCSYNNRAYAGCVPIAIAQVMKYHNYPTSYNWANMPNNFGTTTTASLINDIHNSISGISYDCDGTGVNKDYNTAGLFTNNFNYSTASQSGYNTEIVKQELRLNRPVILGGGRDAGWWIFHNYSDGHMWVCDGFSRSKICMFDDSGNLIGAASYLYFHMNWGWGGYENGWYAFNNFNPGSNTFNYQVKMVYNIKP